MLIPEFSRDPILRQKQNDTIQDPFLQMAIQLQKEVLNLINVSANIAGSSSVDIKESNLMAFRALKKSDQKKIDQARYLFQVAIRDDTKAQLTLKVAQLFFQESDYCKLQANQHILSTEIKADFSLNN